MYIFYRSTEYNPDPSKWYEPEVFIKSTDRGRNWSRPVIIVDPGRPSSFNTDYARSLTSLVNDNGFNSVYVSDMYQMTANNTLHMVFKVTNRVRWGNHYYAYFNFANDKMYTIAKRDMGTTIDRDEYGVSNCCFLYSPSANYIFKQMDKYKRYLTEAIVFEGSADMPTVYYTFYESTSNVSWQNEDFYKYGNTRVKKAKWNGTSWTHTYASGVTDFNNDPLKTVLMVLEGDKVGAGVDLYTKVDNARINTSSVQPFSSWPTDYRYAYPLRVYNTSQGWNNGLNVFSDHPDWEVRGVSSIDLIRNPHNSIRAVIVVPKYTNEIYTTGKDGGILNNYSIGAQYILGNSGL